MPFVGGQRWQHVVRVVVNVHAQRELPQIVAALRWPGGLSDTEDLRRTDGGDEEEDDGGGSYPHGSQRRATRSRHDQVSLRRNGWRSRPAKTCATEIL